METHKENIINALPKSSNHADLLIRVNHLSKLSLPSKTRNELMCQKCLTPWSLGKFTITMHPSNHHRKKRRQHRIERLQKQIKSSEISKTDAVKLTRKLKRLQQLNNHVAEYKCFCNTKTKVQLRKPQIEINSVEEVKHEEKQAKADVAAMEKKAKKKQKKKTAGLIIPEKKSITAPPTTSRSKSEGLSSAKLSSIFEKQKKEMMKKPKLNDFFSK